MSAVSMRIQGGNKLEALLKGMAQKLRSAQNGIHVRIGFLEGATYPVTDRTARFLRGLDYLATGIRRPLKDFDSGKPSPTLSVAQVAFWNEFGTSRAPARPFFRHAIRAHRHEWGGNVGKFLKDTHFDAETAMGRLGQLIKEQIQESITAWPADNAPLTVAVKGFNHGLIDQGIMLRSVDYAVNA